MAAATMLTFFAVQLFAYLRDLVIPCGCRLFDNEQVGPVSLTIDALLFLLCVAIAIDAFHARNGARRTSRVIEQSVA